MSGNTTHLSGQAPTDGSPGLAFWNPATREARIGIPFAALSVNSVYRMVTMAGSRKTWMTISAAGKKWRKNMLLILRPIQAYYPRDEMVDIHITAWYRDRREWDIDNISKPILDILQASVESVIDGTPEWHSMPIIEDDKQVRELTLTKMPYDPDKPDGEIWIDIKPSQSP